MEVILIVVEYIFECFQHIFPGSSCGTVCNTSWFKSDIVWWRRYEPEAVE